MSAEKQRMKYKQVEKRSVVRDVMEQIKALIASGELKPGDKIPTEAELAAMFGIGRSSVREAVKVFQHLGVLESSPRTGTFVCETSNISTEALTWSFLLGRNEIFELITLREVIEQRCIEQLVEKVRAEPERAAETLKVLREELAKMRGALASGALGDQTDADYDFHGAIICSMGNQVFSSVYQTLGAFMREEIRKTNLDEPARTAAVQEHEALLEAITAAETSRALAAYREHLRSTREQLAHSLGELHEPKLED
jgi:GntR family transcriptional repressor for pyruvate dehydrogenase complex